MFGGVEDGSVNHRLLGFRIEGLVFGGVEDGSGVESTHHHLSPLCKIFSWFPFHPKPYSLDPNPAMSLCAISAANSPEGLN